MKPFIVSFIHTSKYWKSSTISSTVSLSLISGFGSVFFNSTFVLSIFITNPLILPNSTFVLSTFITNPLILPNSTCVLSTFITNPLILPREAMHQVSFVLYLCHFQADQCRTQSHQLSFPGFYWLAFLITHPMTTVKRHDANASPYNTPVLTSVICCYSIDYDC